MYAVEIEYRPYIISSTMHSSPSQFTYLHFNIFEILQLTSYNHYWSGGIPNIIAITFAPTTLNLVDILEA